MPILNWHISSYGNFSRIFGRTEINKISSSVSPVETNSFLTPSLEQFIRWCMILWSTSSMLQFEISSSAIMFSMFISMNHYVLLNHWIIISAFEILVFLQIFPQNIPADNFLLSLFVKKLLVKSPGICSK